MKCLRGLTPQTTTAPTNLHNEKPQLLTPKEIGQRENTELSHVTAPEHDLASGIITFPARLKFDAASVQHEECVMIQQTSLLKDATEASTFPNAVEREY